MGACHPTRPLERFLQAHEKPANQFGKHNLKQQVSTDKNVKLRRPVSPTRFSLLRSGARKVVTHIYKNHRGVKQSTRKFFQAVENGTVADTVHQDILNAFRNASWYTDFRRIRDALTHSDIGSCHLDPESGTFRYLHSGLGKENRALVIDDIFSHIEQLMTKINEFMGQVFHVLNSTLNDEETWQICGIFGGRVYSRFVRPSEATDFNSGHCDAFKWFELEENPDCPLMNQCDAYKRRNSEQSPPAYPEGRADAPPGSAEA